MATELMSGNFGVDKLKLHTEIFHVDDIKPLEIVPNRKKSGHDMAEPTALFNCNGQTIYGERAYINADGYNMTISNGRLYLEFNPSKQYDPIKLTANPNKIADSLTRIQKELKETHSIDVDLLSTGIGRIDMTAQAQMNNLVPDYKEIVSGGKKSLRFKPIDYPSGYLVGNLQRQIMAYDKGLKAQIDSQRERGIKKPSELKPSNLLRLETRLLKSEAVQSHSQFKNITHLLNADIDKYTHLYSKCVDGVLRIGQTEINFIEMNVLTDLVRTAISTQKRGQWLLFIVATLNKELPTADQFHEALKRLVFEGHITKGHISKVMGQYSAMLQQTTFARAKYINDSANSYTDRYNEFLEKLILPYKTA